MWPIENHIIIIRLILAKTFGILTNTDKDIARNKNSDFLKTTVNIT